MTTEPVSALSERLYGDRLFATAFERDPFTTLRTVGFADLATAAERDRERIGELVDRIYGDDEFRQRVEQARGRSSSDGAFPRPRSDRCSSSPALPPM